ncbi:hypothetical protein SLEP1_g43857 [Rubroshorea leprosula]|uniref:Uncharacterized protein n=1 Tax=Rubroshorea leprosula TaxID=152421 RepID=A0AAV5LED6_9ROSI|nr:hypothetical protein SLEP1_g43857 [Rubroshorea leprosula]
MKLIQLYATASIHSSTKLAVTKVDPPCSMTKAIRSSPSVTSQFFQTVESNEQADFTREELQLVTSSPPRPIAPAQAASLVIEIDDDVFESEESINATTLLLLELLNGNPSKLCQVIDQNEAFNAAEVLSKAPTLDASVRMFWSNFPTVYKNFSQLFMNEKKVVSEAIAVQILLGNATTKEEDNLKSLKAERSKLLVELKEEGREALATKSEATQQEEKSKEANNTLQQMKDEWATSKQNLC